jgi:hypothetical protein
MCFRRPFRAYQIVFAFLAVTLAVIARLPDAFVVERTPIPSSIHPNRELVLWMLSPQKHDRGPFSESSPYTCPEYTLGSYYSGPTRISLVDAGTKRILNTVKLSHGWYKEDSFDIPYRVLADFYYLVPGHQKGTEGKPSLLTLRDLNGDGLPLETAFFEALACMGLPTTLIGYSPKQDRVIQYQVQLRVQENKIVEGKGIVKTGKSSVQTDTWVDYLFAEKPTAPGRWSYKIDYTGRAGTSNSYDVRYDPIQEKFFGTFTMTIPPWGAQ